MHGRLVLVQHPDPGAREALLARLAGAWAHTGDAGCTLATRGAALRESVDGKAIGARTGVLFNLAEVAEGLSQRGIAASRLDGDGACVEAVAHRGPEGLATLRRHGVVAVLHRAQSGVLVSSDPMGLAPLYVAPTADGRGRVVASDRAALAAVLAGELDASGWSPNAQRVAPGVGLLLARGRLQLMPLRPAPDVAPYLRDRPEAYVRATVDEAAGLLAAGLRASVRAWVADRGPMAPAPHTGLASLLRSACEGAPAVVGGRPSDARPPCPWPPTALPNLFELSQREAEASATATTATPAATIAPATAAPSAAPLPQLGPDDLPEPTTRVATGREAARRARYGQVRQALWEPLVNAAAARDAAVALPHWDPALVALLGAMPHPIVRALGARVLGLAAPAD